jgi:hypothetical protein
MEPVKIATPNEPVNISNMEETGFKEDDLSIFRQV